MNRPGSPESQMSRMLHAVIVLPILGLVMLLAAAAVRWQINDASIVAEVKRIGGEVAAQSNRDESTHPRANEVFAIDAAARELRDKYAPVLDYFELNTSADPEMVERLHQFADESFPVWERVRALDVSLAEIRAPSTDRFGWDRIQTLQNYSRFLTLLLESAVRRDDVGRALEIVKCHERLFRPSDKVNLEMEIQRLRSSSGFLSYAAGLVVRSEVWGVSETKALRDLIAGSIVSSKQFSAAQVQRWSDFILTGSGSGNGSAFHDPLDAWEISPSVRASLLRFLSEEPRGLHVEDVRGGLDTLLQGPFVRFAPLSIEREFRGDSWSIAGSLRNATRIRRDLLSTLRREAIPAEVEARSDSVQ